MNPRKEQATHKNAGLFFREFISIARRAGSAARPTEPHHIQQTRPDRRGTTLNLRKHRFDSRRAAAAVNGVNRQKCVAWIECDAFLSIHAVQSAARSAGRRRRIAC